MPLVGVVGFNFQNGIFKIGCFSTSLCHFDNLRNLATHSQRCLFYFLLACCCSTKAIPWSAWKHLQSLRCSEYIANLESQKKTSRLQQFSTGRGSDVVVGCQARRWPVRLLSVTPYCSYLSVFYYYSCPSNPESLAN